MGEKIRKPSKRALIKEDLLNQLEENGTWGSHFVDLVEDYMALWDLKNKLIKDIKKRGAMIEWANGDTQKGVKKNDAISELPKVNKQMLSLLKELGLQASSTLGGPRGKEDDADEEL